MGEPIHDRRLLVPLLVFVCTALGVIIGRWVAPDPVWMAGGATVLFALCCFRWASPRRVVVFGLAVVCASAAWWDVRIDRAPARVLLEAVEKMEHEPLIAVEGTVEARPERREIARGVFAEHARPGSSTHFRLRDIRLLGDDQGALRGTVWVTVGGALPGVSAGDRVRVWGRLSAAGERRNPGDPPYRLRALQSGMVGFVRVPTADAVERIEAEGSGWLALRGWLRARSTGWLDGAREADDPASAMLLAVLTGERVEALSQTDGAVRRVGVAHLLAISGFHLMLLVLLGGWGARMVREPGRAEPLIAAGLIVMYLMLTPARAPIVRAAAVTLAFVIGEAGGTRWRREALLALAATVTLVWRPMELFSPGFQLSYACVAALMLFQKPMRARLFREPVGIGVLETEGWFRRAVKGSVAAAVVAWMVATPILAYHAGMVNPLGVLVVIVVAPVFSLVLALGFVTSAISIVWPWFGEIVSPVTLSAADFFLRGVLALERVPMMSVHVPRMPAALSAVLFGAVVWWMWSRRSALATAIVAVCVMVFVSVWLVRAERTQGLADDVVLRVDMLDVGDGSFYLLRSGSDAMLWDAGAQSLDFGRRRAPASLRALGVWRVPEVLVTHANLDHFSSLPELTGVLGIQRVRTTGAMVEEGRGDPQSAAALLLRMLEDAGVRVQRIDAGESFVFGDSTVKVLWPDRTADFAKINNLSLVMRLTVQSELGERVVLLTGDIETEAARVLLAREPRLRADILELPHHGSARLAGEGFVKAVDPMIVLQSSGRSRVGDERWDEAREGRVWLMTAEVGAAWAEIARDGTIRSGSMRGGAGD